MRRAILICALAGCLPGQDPAPKPAARKPDPYSGGEAAAGGKEIDDRRIGRGLAAREFHLVEDQDWSGLAGALCLGGDRGRVPFGVHRPVDRDDLFGMKPGVFIEKSPEAFHA